MKKIPSIPAMIIAVVSALVIACAIAGCSSSPTPTQTADTFLKAIQNADTESASKVYSGSIDVGELSGFGSAASTSSSGSTDEASESTQLGQETLEALYSKIRSFTYEVSDEKIDGDKATVDVKITAYDLGGVISDFYSSYMQKALTLAFAGASDDQLTMLAEKELSSAIDNAEMGKEKTVQLTMTKKDGTWMVDDLSGQEDFTDALLGGLISTTKQYNDIYSSGSGK